MESVFKSTDESNNISLVKSSSNTEVANCFSEDKDKTTSNLLTQEEECVSANEASSVVRSDVSLYTEPATENIHHENAGLVGNTDKPGLDHSYALEHDDSSDGQYKNLRPRRSVKKRFVEMEEDEWEKLLSDDSTFHEYGPGQHIDIDEASSNIWVAVEQILGNRKLKSSKITKAVSEAINSFSSNNKEIVEQEYFVKFVDQSYWHCAWMSGAVLFTLNPSKTRAYFRAKQSAHNLTTLSNIRTSTLNDDDNQIENSESNEHKAEDSPYGDTSKCTKAECKLTTLISHSSEEESDDEDNLSKWNKDVELDVNEWIANYPKRAGSRRRYLLRWGVESYTLVPERVLAIGEVFTPEKFKKVGEADPKIKYNRPPSKMKWPEYREVLVKWLHLPYVHATWETVESDLLTLDSPAACGKSQNSLYEVLDPCGRNLLPRLVRRHIIRLTNIYCSRVATMLCDAYGNQLTPGRKTRSSEGWKSKWMGEQPTYLSPIHHGVLHPYQMEGVRWLWHAYHNSVNAILADEMGLGKTVQVIALLYSLWKEENDYGPFIIMAPLSTLQNWEREFSIWAPDFYIVVYSGDKQIRSMLREYEFRLRNAGGIPAFHVLITSHELACIDRAFLKSFDWSVLVVDEAHRLKNKQSRFFRDTSQYQTKFKILLTGTPLQNNLEELFHLLNFVEPKKFTDFRALSEQWAEMPKADRIKHLHDLLKHHLLRRLKADVIQDLPKKTEIVVPVDMTLLQRRLYKYILTNNYEELRCGNLMNSIIHLQKVCDHPYLMQIGDAIAPRLNSDEPNGPYEPKALVQVSSKLIVLMELLRGLFSDGHRVLIFSRLTMMLDILEEVMINAGYKYVRIDGRVRGHLRQVTIDRFNSPNSEFFIFLLSTRAGGEGINLASADTVVLYDSDWNPQWDLQALSRAHRIGQSKHVVIYRFITRHSIEEKISQVARRKLALTQLIVDQHQKRSPKTSENPSVPLLQPLLEEKQQEPVEDDDKVQTLTNMNDSQANQDSISRSDQDHILPDSTQTQSNTKSVTRLTRSEMDELLRSGVEALFASDDSYSTEDLYNAARVDADESRDSCRRIVYDEQAILKLLDRSQMMADSEQTISAADEYLSAFRVAHFDETNTVTDDSEAKHNEELNDNFQESEITEEKTVSVHPTTFIHETNTECIGYAEFWDKLLRERHDRLVNAELESASKSRRNNRSIYRQVLSDLITDKSLDNVEEVTIRKQLKLEKDDEHSTDSSVGDKEKLFNRTEAVREVTKLRLSRQELRKVFNFYHRFEDEKLKSLVEELKSKYASLENENNRTRTRYSKPMPASVKRSRLSKSTGKMASYQPIYPSPSFQDFSTDHIIDFEDSEEECSFPEITSDDDPSYMPSDEGDLVDTVELKDSLPSYRTRKSSSHLQLPSPEPIADGSDSEEFVSGESSSCGVNPTCWHPTARTCAKWRARVYDLGHHITWHQDKLFIYSFGPNDRQLFNNAVMRFGLPPPGIVPPQDWLPPALYHKSQLQLFGYVDLYMKHLYDDPNALIESEENWSDGLPKEHLCVPAVLSRIAMMALIRNKVLQYEDINGATSIPFGVQNNAFKFAIHEGGLTLLRSAWNDECTQISNICQTVQSQSEMARNSELILKTQRVWHSRHDYWLLAGILVHGYSRWTDILSDPRFRILNFGLSGVLTSMNKLMNSELGSRCTSSYRVPSESTEAQAFLLDRLKLLEQALIVEQALHEIAEAALSSSSNKNAPDPSRIKNLAVCLSNKLIQTGARKRIALPKDQKAREATRAVVQNLQEILEDMYADLPGMPASVNFTGGDESSYKERKSKTMSNTSNEYRSGTGSSSSQLSKTNAVTSEVNLCGEDNDDIEQEIIANSNDGHNGNNNRQVSSDKMPSINHEKTNSDRLVLQSKTAPPTPASFETCKSNSSPMPEKEIFIELSDEEDNGNHDSSFGNDHTSQEINIEMDNNTADRNNAGEQCVLPTISNPIHGAFIYSNK